MYVYVYMQTYLQKNSKQMMVGLLPHNHELLYKEIAWGWKDILYDSRDELL